MRPERSALNAAGEHGRVLGRISREQTDEVVSIGIRRLAVQEPIVLDIPSLQELPLAVEVPNV